MALQQDPIETNIQKDLPLAEIFNLHQEQDRSDSFWQQVGEQKHPLLTKALERGIKTSIGQYYRCLAEFMAMLNSYLQDEDFFGITFRSNTDDLRFSTGDDVEGFILETIVGSCVLQASFEISLLRNGRYHLFTTTIDDVSYVDYHSIYLSPKGFEELFSAYLLTSPSPGIHFKRKSRSDVDVEPYFDRLHENLFLRKTQ